MADINLIRDTEAGEQQKEEQQRQRRRSQRSVAWSRPDGTVAQAPPETPKRSVFSGMQGFLRGLFSPGPKKEKISPNEPIRNITAPAVPSRKQPTAPVPQKPVERSQPGTRATGGIGVNLVPEEISGKGARRNYILMVGGVAGIALILIAIAYVGLVLYEGKVFKETDDNNSAIAALDAQLDQLTMAKRQAFHFHATTLQAVNLLDKHLYWTKFLSGLEQYTVDTVYFSSMNADQQGRVTLQGVGKDIRSVARQLLAFREATDFVVDAQITTAQVQEQETGTSVTFPVTLTLVGNVFTRTAAGSATYPITETQP